MQMRIFDLFKRFRSRRAPATTRQRVRLSVTALELRLAPSTILDGALVSPVPTPAPTPVDSTYLVGATATTQSTGPIVSP